MSNFCLHDSIYFLNSTAPHIWDPSGLGSKKTEVKIHCSIALSTAHSFSEVVFARRAVYNFACDNDAWDEATIKASIKMVNMGQPTMDGR